MSTNKDSNEENKKPDPGTQPEDSVSNAWLLDEDESRSSQDKSSPAPADSIRPQDDSKKRKAKESPTRESSQPEPVDDEDDQDEDDTRFKAKSQPIGIIGFSASGKTVYLSMLYHSTAERKIFRSGWHANWASQDNGETKKYLQDISRRVRGYDARGRVIYENPDSPTRVVRSFPPGTVWNTPIRFELLRKWGLRGRSLLVHTEDGVGEVIGQAALHGPENLPPEFRSRWNNTMELCKNSRALLMFINLLNIDEVEIAPDVAFLIDCLIKEGFRPKAVSFVATGMDAWSGRRDMSELRASIEESFHNVFASLDRAKIPWDLHLVSSLGENFARKRTEGLAEGCRSASHICNLCQEITADPKAKPSPRGIDEPWEFIFRQCLPFHSKWPASAIFVDILAILRQKLLNRITIPIYALAALVIFVLYPLWHGEKLHKESQAFLDDEAPQLLRSESAGSTDWPSIYQAFKEWQDKTTPIQNNKIWQWLRPGPADQSERNLDKLGKLHDISLSKSGPTPDYNFLVEHSGSYLQRFGIDPIYRELPVDEWAFKRDTHMIADESSPIAERIASARRLLDRDASSSILLANSEALLAELMDHLLQIEDRFSQVPQDYQDRQATRDAHGNILTYRRELELDGVFPRHFPESFNPLKSKIDELDRFFILLGTFAEMNDQFTRDENPDRAVWADRFNQFYSDNSRYASDFPFIRTALRRSINLRSGVTTGIQEDFSRLPSVPEVSAIEAQSFIKLREAATQYQQFISQHPEGAPLVRQTQGRLQNVIDAMLDLSTTAQRQYREEIRTLNQSIPNTGPASLDDISSQIRRSSELRNEARRIITLIPGGARGPVNDLLAELSTYEDIKNAERRLREELNTEPSNPNEQHALVRALRTMANGLNQNSLQTGMAQYAGKRADRLESEAYRWEAREIIEGNSIPDQRDSAPRNNEQIRSLMNQFHEFLTRAEFKAFDDFREEAEKRRATWFGQITNDQIYLEELRRFAAPEARTNNTAQALRELRSQFSRLFDGSDLLSQVDAISIQTSAGDRRITLQLIPNRIRLPRQLNGPIACAIVVRNGQGEETQAVEWTGQITGDNWQPQDTSAHRSITVEPGGTIWMRIRVGQAPNYSFESMQEFPALFRGDSGDVVEILPDSTLAIVRIIDRSSR